MFNPSSSRTAAAWLYPNGTAMAATITNKYLSSAVPAVRGSHAPYPSRRHLPDMIPSRSQYGGGGTVRHGVRPNSWTQIPRAPGTPAGFTALAMEKVKDDGGEAKGGSRTRGGHSERQERRQGEGMWENIIFRRGGKGGTSSSRKLWAKLSLM